MPGDGDVTPAHYIVFFLPGTNCIPLFSKQKQKHNKLLYQGIHQVMKKIKGSELTIQCPMYSALMPVSYTHLRAHETSLHLVCRLLLEKKKKKKPTHKYTTTISTTTMKRMK
eukprot:TRINITY_DN16251_c0_g1_i2.p3 TRINITY_DN16251_c0_g1~~TRINITY_DN16251_c0_g1_i2.p3  ORF type:complete len:112 (-),score=20.89 TRINITY_DN16251_c0_g1_i2:28-363(-)